MYFYCFALLLRQGLFVAKYGLELTLLLPKPPKCRDYRLATISGFRNAGDWTQGFTGKHSVAELQPQLAPVTTEQYTVTSLGQVEG